MSSQRQTLANYLQRHQAKKFFKDAKKCPAPKLCFNKSISQEVQKKKKIVNGLMSQILAKVKRNVLDAKKSLQIQEMFKISCQQINNEFDSIFQHMNTECPLFLQSTKSNSKIESFSDGTSQISSQGLTSPNRAKILGQKNLNKNSNFQKTESQFGSFLQVPSVQIKNPLVTKRKNNSKENAHTFYSHNVSVNSEEQNQQNLEGIIYQTERDVMNEGFSQITDKINSNKVKAQKNKYRKNTLETNHSNISIFDQN